MLLVNVVFLILLASTNLGIAHGRRKFSPIKIPSCPDGCNCNNIICFQSRSGGHTITCHGVEVLCRGRNFILRLDEMPRNVTHLIIIGDDMGHLSLDVFAKRFQRLKQLILPKNTIRSLRATMKLRYLQTLVLDHNNLCYLPVRGLKQYPALRILRARYNNFTFITDIRFPSRLENLDLRDNHIETPRQGSFRGLRRLKFLRLTNNLIANINPLAFRHLKSLESLHLDYNRISHIPGNAFYFLPNVSFVGLSHNQIDTIDRYAFKQMGVKYHGLHEIRLEHNLIATLETSSISLLFSRQKIYALYMLGNPLFCDCELYQVRRRTGKLLRDAGKTKCISPPELAGVTLAKLNLTGCHEQYEDDDFYDDDEYDDYYKDDEQ